MCYRMLGSNPRRRGCVRSPRSPPGSARSASRRSASAGGAASRDPARRRRRRHRDRQHSRASTSSRTTRIPRIRRSPQNRGRGSERRVVTATVVRSPSAPLRWEDPGARAPAALRPSRWRVCTRSASARVQSQRVGTPTPATARDSAHGDAGQPLCLETHDRYQGSSRVHADATTHHSSRHAV